MDTKNLIRLGFGDVISLTSKIALNNTNPKLDSFFLSKDNFKNLNDPILGLSFKKGISFDPNSKTYVGKAIYTNDKIVNNNYYEAVSKFFMTHRGELENFNIGKIKRDPLDSKFFNKILKYGAAQAQTTGVAYQRFSFPKTFRVTNTSILTGASQIYQTPNINSIIKNSLIEKNNYLYLSNRTGYAIYPQSYFIYKYPKYNYPTNIVPFVSDNSTGNMEGLLVIATGTNESQRIVYVSPHDTKTQLYNTVVENIISTPSRQQKDIETRVDGQWIDADYGNGFWIGVGRSRYGGSTIDITRSTNGKSWNLLSEVLPHSAQWENIVYGNDRWIALPYTHNVSFAKGATSTDNGQSWSEIAIDGTNNGQYLPMTQFKKIVFNGSNRWVILGRDSSDRTLTSTDGINWTGNASLPTAAGMTQYFTLAFGDGKWVALNNAGGSYYAPSMGAFSTNGITWQEMSIPTTLDYKYLEYGNGRFIGLPSYGNTYITSTNGTGWSSPPNFLSTSLPNNISWGGLTYDGKEWIIIPSNYGNLNSLSGYKSANGINWTGFKLANAPTPKYWNNMITNTGVETTLMLGNDYIRRLSAPSLEYQKVTYSMTLTGVSVDSKHINSGNIFLNGFVKLTPTEKVNLLSGLILSLDTTFGDTTPITEEERNFFSSLITQGVNEINYYSGRNQLDDYYGCNLASIFEDTGVLFSGFDSSTIAYNSSGCGRLYAIDDLNTYFELSGELASGAYSDTYGISNINIESFIPYTEYKINNNYLKQTTPLKDTWFYKIYSGIYSSGNGSKLLNTGTWNGIVPSGTNIYIEYISTNDTVGSNNTEFLITYTGYGSNNDIDIELRSTIPFDTGINRNTYVKTFISKSYLSTYNAAWRNKLFFQKWKRNKYASLYKDIAYNSSKTQVKIQNFISGKSL